MKLAVMQPYLFPYLGYFQLIRAVDAFVVYDDVNFINRGWINRNSILAQGKALRFTMELEAASQNKLINEIEVKGRNDKLLKSIRQSYSKAPYFSQVFPVIEDILNQQERNLAHFLNYQLRKICDYLGLFPQWHFSSDIKKDKSLRGQDKILAICQELGAEHYINLPGGVELYDRHFFDSKGIELTFIQPLHSSYPQFGNEFVPHLSIIDVMMFNSPGGIQNKLLKSYNINKT